MCHRELKGEKQMSDAFRVLVIQTAFIGDVILTLPMIQALKRHKPEAMIDFLTIPRSAPVLTNHPAINTIILYDKKGKDRGLFSLISQGLVLRKTYDIALVPHRSIRSAMLALLAGIPKRIGFDTSDGRLLFTHQIKYRFDDHEIERNLSLLTPLQIEEGDIVLPDIYPSKSDQIKAEHITTQIHPPLNKIVAFAPGSIWATKRWTKEGFSSLASMLIEAGVGVILLGGSEDRGLCEEIRLSSASSSILSTAGELSLTESAALLGTCSLLITNDSAPLHLGVAMRTPVIAIFGATVPEFGFSPVGLFDSVIEIDGLECRPCGIHGGDSCPIGTFVCMKNIPAELVFQKVQETLASIEKTTPQLASALRVNRGI
jgi:heptosyltransferase-2